MKQRVNTDTDVGYMWRLFPHKGKGFNRRRSGGTHSDEADTIHIFYTNTQTSHKRHEAKKECKDYPVLLFSLFLPLSSTCRGTVHPAVYIHLNRSMHKRIAHPTPNEVLWLVLLFNMGITLTHIGDNLQISQKKWCKTESLMCHFYLDFLNFHILLYFYNPLSVMSSPPLLFNIMSFPANFFIPYALFISEMFLVFLLSAKRTTCKHTN